MIGFLFKLATVFGLGTVFLRPKAKVDPNKPNPQDPKDKPKPDIDDDTIAGYEFEEAFLAGGSPADKLATIILLHWDDSTPTEAFEVLKGLGHKAHVLMPLGPVVTANGRAWVGPTLQGATLMKALHEQAWALQGFVSGVLERYKLTDRLVVVGLGITGPIAVSLGLEGGEWVKLAYGTGGIFTADWVPLLQDPHAIAVRKLSYGDAIGFEQLALKTANERGIDFLFFYKADADQIGNALDVGTQQLWLQPLLAADLEASDKTNPVVVPVKASLAASFQALTLRLHPASLLKADAEKAAILLAAVAIKNGWEVSSVRVVSLTLGDPQKPMPAVVAKLQGRVDRPTALAWIEELRAQPGWVVDDAGVTDVPPAPADGTTILKFTLNNAVLNDARLQLLNGALSELATVQGWNLDSITDTEAGFEVQLSHPTPGPDRLVAVANQLLKLSASEWSLDSMTTTT